MELWAEEPYRWAAQEVQPHGSPAGRQPPDGQVEGGSVSPDQGRGAIPTGWAELANVWLSTYFGNQVPDDDYYEMQNRINPEKFPDWSWLRGQKWFCGRSRSQGRKCSFTGSLSIRRHSRGENRGFDVVIVGILHTMNYLKLQADEK